MGQMQTASSPTVPLSDTPIFNTGRFDLARRYTADFSRHVIELPQSRGEMRFVHYHQIHLGGTTFDRVSVEHVDHFRVSAPQIRDHFLLQLNFAGECLVEQDHTRHLSRAGSMFVINPETAASKRWANECHQMMVWFRKDALYETLARELKCSLDMPLRFFWPEEDDHERLSAYWQQVIQTFMHLYEHKDQIHWRNIRQLEQSLLIGLLTAVPNNYADALENVGTLVAPHYVRRVEKFLKAHFAEPLTMADIHNVACVSERTLFYGFRQFRQTTPMAFLRRIRLEQAREALLHAARDGGSVTSIATNCGFCNVSAFAREYKAMFSETPSQTLRRGVS